MRRPENAIGETERNAGSECAVEGHRLAKPEWDAEDRPGFERRTCIENRFAGERHAIELRALLGRQTVLVECGDDRAQVRSNGLRSEDHRSRGSPLFDFAPQKLQCVIVGKLLQ